MTKEVIPTNLSLKTLRKRIIKAVNAEYSTLYFCPECGGIILNPGYTCPFCDYSGGNYLEMENPL